MDLILSVDSEAITTAIDSSYPPESLSSLRETGSIDMADH